LLIKFETISISDKNSNHSHLTIKIANGENKNVPGQKVKIKDHFDAVF